MIFDSCAGARGRQKLGTVLTLVAALFAAQGVASAQTPGLLTPSLQPAAQPAAQPPPAPIPLPAPAAALPKPPTPPPEPGEYGYAMPSLYGPSGGLRVFSADSGPAGSFRFQLSGEAFRATDFLAPGDTNNRVGGRFQLGVSPTDWLEIFATFTGNSNDNNRGTPPLIQVQGDFAFGLKGCYRLNDWFCLGAMGGLQFLTGAGDISFTGKSTSAHLRLLASADFTRMAERLPLRVHFNFGGYIDNSDALDNPQFTAVQRYALRINQSSRVFLGLLVEAPVSRYVTPFLEYQLEVPVGLPAAAAGTVDAGSSAYPNILSVGARIFPWRQLSLLAAVDIGITSAGRQGVPAIPPWQLVFGIGWAFDTSAVRGETRVVERVVEKIVEKEKLVVKEVPIPTPQTPLTGVLLGAIIDSKTAAPVPDAVIRFLNADNSPVLSSKDKGQFRVPEVRPGRLQLRIEREGYKPADFEVEIVAGKPTANSFPIDRLDAQKQAVLVGKLANEDGRPLVGIVEVRNTAGGDAKKLATDPSSGAFVGSFPVGQYHVSARSTGYLSQDKTVSLSDKDRVVVDFSLRKEPEKRLARIEGSKIVIDKQLNFKKGSAKIIGKESFSILDEVVDILARHSSIKKVRIEGHTDNAGGKAYNKKLSDKRARSVMEYLIMRGIAPARISSEGFGQSRPLVPNTSKKNKAKNRRVEFIIGEQ